MAITNLDAFFKQIEKDFIKISKEAARNTAKRVQEDVREKSDQFISEYYEYKPKMYKNRKKALYKLVEDVYSESESADGVMIEFGIKYDPSKIQGMHQSNSWYHQTGTEWISRLSPEFDFDSQNHGTPEEVWITTKFLEGIHPSGKIGDEGGHRDAKSPDQKMKEFFNKELQHKINTYMTEELLRAVNAYF